MLQELNHGSRFSCMRAAITAAAFVGGVLSTALAARAEEVPAGEGGLEIVTVSARRQTERLIDVPVAASVLGAQDIEKYALTDLTQIESVAPGLNIVREPGGFPGAAISIRGIQNFGTGDAGLEQPVSVIVDGIPISRGYIVDAGFFDLADIQVLKGPQALFFGKDSPAGVVALESVTPKPGEPRTGYLKANYGFIERDPVIEGAISLPVGDTLAVRLALRGEDMQGGYMKNGAVPLAANPSGYLVPGPNYDRYPQTKQAIGRFSAVWAPSDAFDVTLKYLQSYYHDDGANGPTVLTNCDNGQHPFFNNLLTGAFIQDTNATCGNRRTTYSGSQPPIILNGFPNAPKDGKYYTRVQQQLTSLIAAYRLPKLEITSNTGFYHVKASEFDTYDMDVFAEVPVFQAETTSLVTEELRAVTRFDSSLNFTFGGFFENERRSYLQDGRIFTLGPYPVPGPFFGITSDWINDDHNYAQDYSFFGQARWHIVPQLELAAGGRWTKARKHSTLGQPFQYIDLFYPDPATQDPNFTPSGNVYRLHTTYNNFSPEVTLTWHPSTNMTVYAAYKTGFLAGGVENSAIIPNYTQLPQSQITANLTYAPETDKGEEVGIKVNGLGGRFSGDLTLYHYIYDNLQIATYHVATTSFTIGNAASSVNQGVDLNAAYRANDQLTLRTFIGYVDNKFRDYPNAPCYSGQICPNGTQDLSGTAFSAPRWEGHFGFNYEAGLTGQLRFALSADSASFSRTPLINRQPGTATAAHTLLNASIRVFQADGPWEIALMGTNLTDEFYASNIFGKPLGKNQDIIAVANPGREIRLQGQYRF
jgi:iron complex outermembrane receptor protein